MGQCAEPVPVKYFCGMLAGSEALLDRAKEELCALWGETDLESPVWPFTATSYYRDEMGDGLLRRFVAFRELRNPGELVAFKCATQDLEARHGTHEAAALRRTVNLDPGYLCASRLVLATTKDFSHRIYLSRGIYAEVTLNFQEQGIRFHDWTYPDFQSEDYLLFFQVLRQMYLAQLPAQLSST